MTAIFRSRPEATSGFFCYSALLGLARRWGGISENVGFLKALLVLRGYMHLEAYEKQPYKNDRKLFGLSARPLSYPGLVLGT